jgi:hypothetical protein
MVQLSEPLRRQGLGDKMGLPNITLISASAGSGKTYRLTEKLAEALNGGLDPERVLATTFTNKAAAELTERVRTSLLGQGEWEKAQRIFDGYVGTVNSVCGRFLKDFAFEAGLSPTLDVLPEGEDQAIYEKAIASVVQKHAPEIDPIARRFEVDNWRDDVKSISDLARTNNITPESLTESATRSLKTFQKLLPKAEPEAKESQLDKSLFEAQSVVRPQTLYDDALPTPSKNGRNIIMKMFVRGSTLQDWEKRCSDALLRNYPKRNVSIQISWIVFLRKTVLTTCTILLLNVHMSDTPRSVGGEASSCSFPHNSQPAILRRTERDRGFTLLGRSLGRCKWLPYRSPGKTKDFPGIKLVYLYRKSQEFPGTRA